MRRRVILGAVLTAFAGVLVAATVNGRAIVRVVRRRGEIPVTRSLAELEATHTYTIGGLPVKLGVDNTTGSPGGFVLVYVSVSGKVAAGDFFRVRRRGELGAPIGWPYPGTPSPGRLILVQSVPLSDELEQNVEVLHEDRVVASVTIDATAVPFQPVMAFRRSRPGGPDSFTPFRYAAVPNVTRIDGSDARAGDVFELPATLTNSRPNLSLEGGRDGFVLGSKHFAFVTGRTGEWVEKFFLLRLWINDRAYLPQERYDDALSLRVPPLTRGADDHRLEFALDFSHATRIARPGDRLGVQVIWSGGGWRAQHDEMIQGMCEDEPFGVSNRVDYVLR